MGLMLLPVLPASVSLVSLNVTLIFYIVLQVLALQSWTQTQV